MRVEQLEPKSQISTDARHLIVRYLLIMTRGNASVSFSKNDTIVTLQTDMSDLFIHVIKDYLILRSY
jgi:hypothetical protein